MICSVLHAHLHLQTGYRKAIVVTLGLLFAVLANSANAFMASKNVNHHTKFLPKTLPIRSQTFLNENSNNNDNDNNDGIDGVFNRFLNPKIDDPWLPLNEAGVAQVIAPTLQLVWLVMADSPFPSWAQPLYDPTFAARGAFLAPTLVHGAGLAICWLIGCVAAKAFERQAYEGTFDQVFTSTIKAGAFACGVLILATQFDLYQDIGFAQPGDSPETDLRIYRALVEVVNDTFFEAITLISYRMLRFAITR